MAKSYRIVSSRFWGTAVWVFVILSLIPVLAGCLQARAGSESGPNAAIKSDCGPPESLKSVKTWMYQLQALDRPGAVEALTRENYDLLVLEPGQNFKDYPYETRSMTRMLSRKPDGAPRILLAYVDIGQAEDYRSYWKSSWSAPTGKKRGSPDFLVTIDPDGWSGNYPVAFWRPEWKKIWLGAKGVIADLVRSGFHGVYLDWVEAYDDEAIKRAAAEDGVDAEEEMILFIEEIRQAGRDLCPGFLVVPQNAPYLIEHDPERYLAAIDGLAVEDTWFHGEGDAPWDDPRAGDLRERHDDEWSTAARLKVYRRYLEKGLPVFSVDYCLKPANAAYVYQKAVRAGLVPLVTRVSLSRITETPPWDFFHSGHFR